MSMCPVCATVSPDGSVHCGTCGELLDASFAPRKRYRALLASALALLTIGGFLYWRAGGFSGVSHVKTAQSPPPAVNPLSQMASAVGQ